MDMNKNQQRWHKKHWFPRALEKAQCAKASSSWSPNSQRVNL